MKRDASMTDLTGSLLRYVGWRPEGNVLRPYLVLEQSRDDRARVVGAFRTPLPRLKLTLLSPGGITTDAYVRENQVGALLSGSSIKDDAGRSWRTLPKL